MQLYNTLTKRQEPFVPLGEPVRMYVCGITPYATTHLGHARTYVFFDLLHRYLRHLGHDVRYVQNITDVDEPLFRRAEELGVSYVALAAENVATYVADMAALNVLPPAHYVPASAEIPEMIRVIGGLIDRGHAYQRGGAVFFRVASDPRYGVLGGLSRAEMATRSAEHGNDLADPHKEQPLDFVLWQPSAPGQPSWPSPWGPGRPGWHIECSTIVLQHLGAQIDIHGGGDDLIYPHHEDEIAQSEGFTGIRPFARYWLHAGMVRLGGIKMSKSLGNLVMVHDLLRQYSPDALRFYLLGYAYREAFDYQPEQLSKAEVALRRLREAATLGPADLGAALDPSPFRAQFLAALDDNLNTPAARTTLVALGEAIAQASAGGRDVRAAQASLRELAALLGLAAVA